MSKKKKGQNASRRKVLKSLVIAGSATGAMNALPSNWKKPVVASVALPAHAHTSGTLANCISGTYTGIFEYVYTLAKSAGTTSGTFGGGNYGGTFNNGVFSVSSTFTSTAGVCDNGDCSTGLVGLVGTFGNGGSGGYSRYCGHHQVGTALGILDVSDGSGSTLTVAQAASWTYCPDLFEFGPSCSS